MSLAHQSNVASAGANFTCLKCCRLVVRHLQPIYPEVLKLALLSSPPCASTLFDESELSKLISLTGQSSLLQSQQAIVDLASSALRRPRSPRRSPRSSSYGSSRSKSPKSPSRSPKLVCFPGRVNSPIRTHPPNSYALSKKKLLPENKSIKSKSFRLKRNYNHIPIIPEECKLLPPYL